MPEAEDIYRGYERWKNWTALFTIDADTAGYFDGELQGSALGGANVLELGFGAGDFIAWARNAGANVVGTEVNNVLLDAARQHGIETLPAAIDTVADQNAARFDAIVAFDVFEHLDLDGVRTALAACATMLKPGGRLFLRFPNAQSPFGLPPQNGDITHKSKLSRSAFEQMIDHNAFQIERYGPPFRFLGSRVWSQPMRRVRGVVQDVFSGLLNTIFAQNIPWHPVVVLVMRRREAQAVLADPAAQAIMKRP